MQHILVPLGMSFRAQKTLPLWQPASIRHGSIPLMNLFLVNVSNILKLLIRNELLDF